MIRRRVLLAGLFHETNTFVPGETPEKEFQVLRGRQMLEKKGDGSPLGGFLQAAEDLNWEVVPALDARAKPGAAVPHRLVREFLDELLTAGRLAGEVDAVFLILHGAMATSSCSDVEGALLVALREIPTLAKIPIFGALDLHANFTPAMADHSNGLVTYRNNPHTDAVETTVRAARLLATALDRAKECRTHFVGTALLWPPSGTGTGDEPMQTLEMIAREEERDGVWAVNVFAGFAHADVPEAGVSFSIVYDPELVSLGRLDQLENRLRTAAWEGRRYALAEEWELGAAVEDAQRKNQFPVCLVEASDNIGGGGTGDGTAVLRALLERKIADGGVVLVDPETVAFLQTQEEGGIFDLHVGGKNHPFDVGPVALRARLIRCSDGAFKLEDRHSHAASMSGENIQMGPCALIECEGTTILLTSWRTSPSDLGQWRSQGVDPEKFTFIGIKAAVAYRQAYQKIARAHYPVRTPGPCNSDLRSLHYRNIRRPIFPLDAI